MRINLKHLTISCILVLVIFAFIFLGTDYLKTVKVEFESKTEKTFEYSLFWIKEEKESFSGKLRISQTVKEGKTRVEFFIPTREVSKLRIDFADNPGKVEISNLKINGKTIDFSSFIPNNHIKNLENKPTSISFFSDGNDPFIVSETLHYTAKENIAPFHFLWVLFGIYTIYMIMQTFGRKSSTAQNLKEKFSNIEFLRIFFTIMVVISHIFNLLKKTCSAGDYAVEFFFVLSGFFLVWTFNPNKSIVKTMIKKYIAWTPLIVWGGILSGGGIIAFRGMLYLQNTGLADWKDIPNAPAWYLAVLFWSSLFYVTLIKYLSENTRNILIGCLIFICSIQLQHIHGGRLDLAFSFIPLGLLRGIIGMGLGYFLAIYLKEKDLSNITTKKSSLLLCSFIEFILIAWITISPFYREYRTNCRVIVPIAMVALIYLFILKRGFISRVLNRPLFCVLAKPCLAVYLTHWAVTESLKTTLYQNSSISNNLFLTIITVILSSWLLGMISRIIIENPCNKLFENRDKIVEN